MRRLLPALVWSGLCGFALIGAPQGQAAAADSWRRAVPYPQASAESRAAAQAVLSGAGSEECLRGKLSNALLQLSNSCDVNGHSTSACELAGRLSGSEGELSVGEMLSTSESLLQMLEDGTSTPD